MTDRLYRSRDDRMISGVAGGVAEMLDADPSIIRIVWALLAFLTGGIGLLVYVVMWIVVPERPEGMPVVPRTADPGTSGATEPVPEGRWMAPDGSTVPMAGAAPAAAASTPEAAAAPGAAPAAPGAAPTARRRPRDPAERTRAGLVAGMLLILIGGFFLVRQFVPSIDVSLWWPTAAIIAGVLLVVLALLPPRRSS